jgi:hypothetical protein
MQSAIEKFTIWFKVSTENKMNNYEQSLIEMVSSPVTVINTELFDGCVQAAELSLFLQSNNCEVTFLDISGIRDKYIGLHSRLFYIITTGFTTSRILRYLRNHKINIYRFRFWNYLTLRSTRLFKKQLELNDYELTCYQASLRNQNTQSLVEFWDSRQSISKRHFRIFQILISYFNRLKPSHVVLTNGRFLIQTLAYLACRRLNIRVTMLEGGGRPYTFELYRSSPHKPSDYRSRVLEFYNSQETPLRISKEDITASPDWLSNISQDKILATFITRQQQDLNYFSEFDQNRFSKSVIYYTSSMWEYPSIPEFNKINPLEDYSKNLMNLYRICKSLDLRLVVKVHPNPDDIEYENLENAFWMKLCHGLDIEIIEAGSGIKSSELMTSCWTNVVEASSVSLECVAFGMPVITLDETPWFDPLQVPIPSNIDQLKELILSRPVYQFEYILPYINYRRFGGIPYRHFAVSEKEIRVVGGVLLASRDRYDRAFQYRERLRTWLKAHKMSVLSTLRDKFPPNS